MKVIYKEVTDKHLSNKALRKIQKISNTSKRHNINGYYNNSLDMYYSLIGKEDHLVNVKETDQGIELTILST